MKQTKRMLGIGRISGKLTTEKLKLVIGITSFAIVASFILPWQRSLSGFDLLVNTWLNPDYRVIFTIAARLCVIGFVYSVYKIFYKTYFKKMDYGHDVKITFVLPTLWLLFFLLSNYVTALRISDYGSPFASYSFGFLIVFIFSLIFSFIGYYIPEQKKVIKRKVGFGNWILRLLLLIGLIYPCIAWVMSEPVTALLSFRSVRGDSNLWIWFVKALSRSWMHIAVSIICWLFFVQYRFARRVFAVIGFWGLLLMCLNYVFPRFTESRYFEFSSLLKGSYWVFLAHAWTPYVIVAIIFILSRKALKLTCPSCKVFYSGIVLDRKYAGKTTAEYSYLKRVKVEDYRNEPNADQALVMWANKDSYVDVPRKRTITSHMYNLSVCCRECGYKWETLA